MMRLILMVLFIIFLFFTLQGKELAVLPELVNPDMMAIQNQQLFILEGSRVLAYSMKDFKLLKEFGKQGDGPGELNTSTQLKARMQVGDGHIYLSTPFKWVKYSVEGKFIGEKRLPFIGFPVLSFGERFAIAKYIGSNDGVNKQAVILFDKDLKEIKKLYEKEILDFRKTGKIDIIPQLVLLKNGGGRLYVLDQGKGVYLEVFNVTGDRVRAIQLDSEKIKVTDDYRNQVMEWLGTQPGFKLIPEDFKSKIYIPDYLPAVKDFLIADGKIYIHTYKKREEGAEFIILDLEGKLLKRLIIPGSEKNIIEPSPYAIIQNRFYYLKEDIDEEEWALHLVTLN